MAQPRAIKLAIKKQNLIKEITMMIKNKQALKKARIFCLTLSLLLNITAQLQAVQEDIEGKSSSLNFTVAYTGKGVKLCIIDGYFDPQSDTRLSLTQSTQKAFRGKSSDMLTSTAQVLGRDHANHVSSIIHLKAPQAVMRIIDLNNEPFVKDTGSHNARLIAAIDAAIASEVAFINISQRISPDTDWDGKRI
jgi:hypothetical protein